MMTLFTFVLCLADDEVASTPPLVIIGKPHLPFQLQTEYTTVDGSVLARVISKVKPVTDRVVAERGRQNDHTQTPQNYVCRLTVSLSDIDIDASVTA